MELLIAGAVLFAGYRLSDARGGAREPRERPTYARLPGAGIDEPQRTTEAADEDLRRRAAAAMDAARDPAATGRVASSTLPVGPVPFFRSARTQNFSADVAQRRMEAYTGATSLDASATGTWRSKREVQAMFDPRQGAQPVTSGGTAGNAPATHDRGRMEPGVVRNNELPAEQVRVGPGVGVGPDVAAADGFHPMYRVLPCDLAYRKNPLPGGVVSGAHRVGKGPRAGAFHVRPRTGATVCTGRDPLPTSGATRAHRVYPRVPIRAKPQEVLVENHVGGPGLRGPHAGAGCGVFAGTRKNRRHPDTELPWLNLVGPEGAGAFTHSRHDMRPQRRDAEGRLGVATGPEAQTAPGAGVARHTQRETLDAMPLGGVGVVRSTGAVRTADAKATLRQDLGAPPLLGAVAAVKGGSLNNVYRHERPLRVTKRSVQHVGSGFLEGRAPQASRINRVRSGDVGAVGVRGRERPSARAATPSAPQRYASQVGASAGTHNKLPSLNPRLDLSLARDQLRCNKFALPSIWDVANS